MKVPAEVAIEEMKCQPQEPDFVQWVKNNEEMNYCRRKFEYFSLDDFFSQEPLKSGRKEYIKLQEKSESKDKCQCTGKCNITCQNACCSTECNKYNCNVGANCGNRWTDKTLWAMNSCVPNGEGGDKGTGLRAMVCIKSNTCIGPYVGTIRLVKSKIKKGNYQAQLGKFIVDSEEKGNITRFINHSDEPNCEMVLRSVDGQDILFIVSIREIQEKEFLSICYDKDYEP